MPAVSVGVLAEFCAPTSPSHATKMMLPLVRGLPNAADATVEAKVVSRPTATCFCTKAIGLDVGHWIDWLIFKLDFYFYPAVGVDRRSCCHSDSTGVAYDEHWLLA